MDIHMRDKVRRLIGEYLLCMVDQNELDALRDIWKGSYFTKYHRYVADHAEMAGKVMRKVEALPPEGRELFDSIINQLGEGFDIVPVNVESLEDMTNA